MKELLRRGDELRAQGVSPEDTIREIDRLVQEEVSVALQELNDWTEESGKKEVWFGPKPKANEGAQELLDPIDDPAPVIEEIVDFREEAKDKDSMPFTKLRFDRNRAFYLPPQEPNDLPPLPLIPRRFIMPPWVEEKLKENEKMRRRDHSDDNIHMKQDIEVTI